MVDAMRGVLDQVGQGGQKSPLDMWKESLTGGKGKGIGIGSVLDAGAKKLADSITNPGPPQSNIQTQA